VNVAVSRQPLRLVPSDSFGSLLRRQRRTDRLTQAALGARFGVTQQTIGAWEHDERPRSRFFSELAGYLGMDLEELVELIDRRDEIHETPAEESADTHARMMEQLALSFMEAQQSGSLSPQVADAYRELFTYYSRADRGKEPSQP
jgi:transcriptional regulator with XRE-family HTH domain